MSNFVLWVELTAKPGQVERLRSELLNVGRASLGDEPGCHRFDVLKLRNSPDNLAIYEVYEDETAYKAHKETPHFKAFLPLAGDLVAELASREFDLPDAGGH